MENNGWNDFEIGAMLRSFDGPMDEIATTLQEDRPYSPNNSFSTR